MITRRLYNKLNNIERRNFRVFIHFSRTNVKFKECILNTANANTISNIDREIAINLARRLGWL